MDSQLKVSIVIPIYNVEDYVEACLSSVFNQSYKNLEVVIVDDCGEDRSMDVIYAFLEKESAVFSNVKILHHSARKGLSAARNTGIRHSTGDYLFFLDSDDEICLECIEKLVMMQEMMNADIVVGNYRTSIPTEDTFPSLDTSITCLKSKKEIIKKYMKGHIYMMAWNKLIRRNFLLSHNLFFREGVIHEDDLWSFKCFCWCRCVAVVKEYTYIYRIRQGSIMNASTFEQKFHSRLQIIKEMSLFAASYHLTTNRHVHSHVENEKLQVLHLCKQANQREVGANFYNYCLELPVASRMRILKWYFFNQKKMIRDAHYFMRAPENEIYYWNMPEMLQCRKGRISYYSWIVQILIRYMFRRKFLQRV